MENMEKLKKRLRKMTIREIFDHYDGEILGLDHRKRSIKYNKMVTNPFQFFRGSAYLFYYDVSRLPISYHTPEDKPTWIQGDLHFDNFGGLRNEQGEIVFDSNDFDEGYLGSYLYDVYRMATSIGLYAEQLEYGEEDQAVFIDTYLRAYHHQLEEFVKRGGDPSTLLFTKNNTGGPVEETLRDLENREAAEKLNQMTEVKDGERRFKVEGKLKRLSKKERKGLEEAWPKYIQSLNENKESVAEYFAIKDAVKLEGAGTGSIGLMRFFILVEGPGEEHADDVILEAKEARYPATGHYFSYDDLFHSEEGLHHGRRVIQTQKAMHYLQDPFLGFFTIGNHHFYVRESTAFEEEVAPEQLLDRDSMLATVETMGRVTAKLHARADSDVDASLPHDSEVEILNAIGNLDRFVDDLTWMGMFYKHRVEEDFQLFTEWLEEEFQKREE
ncbi:DUF2252 domain-containing protein [Thalassobacillus devorans]|uniref:DUF2252 domain-containing protein n=1 Tax=Thalassobacillus devorans TaxID=279813 RepID=UPI00048DDD9B|nr:DUF2252 family protein [Thalassobacillus devorans]